MKITKIISTIIFTATLSIISYSQWNSNPYHNTPVCTAPNNQYTAVSVSDGNGGAIVAWKDSYNNSMSIYVQKYNSSGVAQWGVNGINLSSSINQAFDMQIVSDGNGGAIICWLGSQPNITDMYYARKINSSGLIQWSNDVSVTASNNAAVSDESGDVIADGNGGIIICYRRRSSITFQWEIHAQKISSSGQRIWGENAAVVMAMGNATEFNFPVLCTDMSGGAIIVWDDSRGSSIFAQRLNSGGVKQWNAAGMDVFEGAIRNRQMHRVCSDGQYGAIVVCEDDRQFGTGVYDIYAQRIVDNFRVWGNTGKPICTLATNQTNPEVIYDKNYGAYITWIDKSNPVYKIFLQRINMNGSPYFALNGIETNGANQHMSSINMANNDSNAVFISCIVNGGIDTQYVYAQKILSNGTKPWGNNYVPVSTYPSIKSMFNQALAADNTGGMMSFWEDYRITNDRNIYGHKIQSDGLTGINLMNEIPSQFELKQNYPNPFNPNTNIEYSISKADNVKIIIYNAEGKEISALVNEFQKAGTYKLDFNAAGLSTGVYFYKLVTPGYTETKKMILIK